MNGGRRVFAVGLCLLLIVSSLALAACDQPPYETEVSGPSPGATPDCGTVGAALAVGPFDVHPQDEPPENAQACLQPAASWEQLVGEGLADWGYGVGTFLGDGAVVFLPDDEGTISMQVNTEIHLPDVSGGDLSLIMGTIAVYWLKTVGHITNIVVGGLAIDPDYMIMEISTDPVRQTTSIEVYEGEDVTVTVLSTGQIYTIPSGQSALFVLEEEPRFEILSGPNPPEIDRLLEEWGGQGEVIPEGLDYTLDPNFGETELAAGFMPDPFEIDITSGGVIDVRAMNYGSGCAGYATREPDFRVRWSGESNTLYVYFEAEEEGQDATLVINDPEGNWICNDDYYELNPLIRMDAPLQGQYDIWVGSYSSEDYVPGRLYVTEIEPEY